MVISLAQPVPSEEGIASSVRQIIIQWLLSISQNTTAGKAKGADQLVERSPSAHKGLFDVSNANNNNKLH